MSRIDCAICLETTPWKQTDRYKFGPKGNDVTLLECGHVYHRKCLKNWYRVGHTCPCCRRDIHVCQETGILWDFVILYTFFKNHPSSTHFEDEINDGYIYFDNAGTLLFIQDVLIERTHFCNWFKEIRRVLHKHARNQAQS